ncbi:MAG: sigma-54-dependent Fis family transcriptional regulator [Bacillota bacterium]|jgi:transcriptional regulator of acetoin/glycerol metabolism
MRKTDERKRGLHQAWEDFINRGVIDEDVVRPEIARSWRRCRKLDVDPMVGQVMAALSPAELELTKKKRELLLNTARPYVKLLSDYAVKSGFTVFLADPKGTVLILDGDRAEIERQSRVNLREGAIWSERYAGTNAVGTSIFTKSPLQVVGEEHYCAFQHRITCSGAPICGPDGALVGILSMSGNSEHVNIHTLGMVVACAQAIENQIMLIETMEELRNRNLLMNATLESVPNALIAIDKGGRVTQVNSLGLKMLNRGVEDVIGEKLTRLIPGKPDLLSLIESGRADGVEILLENIDPVVRCNISSNEIYDHRGHYHGAVLLFNKREQVVKLVNQITGAHSKFGFDALVGEDSSYLEAKRIAKEVAKTNASVLLLGESGTGKEMFAQAIHEQSAREGPFIAINCAAIPRSLMESELFGYEASAFTGASRNGRPGKFELAHKGTLLLDEIGDMPLDLQAAILRVLQEREVVRIGGHKSLPIDVRIIASTNCDLRRKIREKTFREDLYYRINVVTIKISPLRQRKSDITLLSSALLHGINRRMNKAVVGITDEALAILRDHDWPGNVRELENVLERGVVLARDNYIGVEDLPDYIVSKREEPREEPAEPPSDDDEKDIIEDAVKKNRTMALAAKSLGMSRSTLYRKLKKYGQSRTALLK